MKTLLAFSLAFVFMGCSLVGTKKVPEVVSSCFGEGDNQELYCKSQRVAEDGKIAITRCIGSSNQETAPNLRGKCAEKICAVGSQTDCQVRGEHLVLEKYAELATAKLFKDDEEAQAQKVDLKTKVAGSGKKSKVKKAAELIAPPEQSATAAEPEEVAAIPKKKIVAEPAPAEQEMTIALKPTKKVRKVASATAGDDAAFKKICVSKNESTAPQNIRGKCATRACNAGKCTYKGRKEIFEWARK